MGARWSWSAMCKNGHIYGNFSGGADDCPECGAPPKREIHDHGMSREEIHVALTGPERCPTCRRPFVAQDPAGGFGNLSAVTNRSSLLTSTPSAGDSPVATVGVPAAGSEQPAVNICVDCGGKGCEHCQGGVIR